MSTFGIRISSLLLAVASCFGADVDLKALYDAHRWFELREALRQEKGTALYRGAVAAAFQQIKDAERELKPLGSDESRALLGAMYFRNGVYTSGAALGHPEIAELPDQIVVGLKRSRVRGQIHDDALWIPVSINGKDAKALVDTDSNMSMLSESEALRLGLRTLGAVSTAGASGVGGRGKLAVAERLEIGGLRIRNAAFAVIGDQQQPFKDLPEGERLILGLPVILAMQSVRWSRDGGIEIGGEKARANAHPNLCFDAMDPIASVEYRI